MTVPDNMQTEDVPEVDESMEAAILRSGHERCLALRDRLEYYYSSLKQTQHEHEAGLHAIAKRRKAFYLEVIRVVDSFEDVFRMFDKSHKLKKQQDALAYFHTTYQLLRDALETEGVHQVDIMGLTYDEVELEGITIPEPWVVVGCEEGGEKGRAGRVKEVQRALWVQVAGNRLAVLRRAQVTY